MTAIRHYRVIWTTDGPLAHDIGPYYTRRDPDSRFAGLRNTAPTMANRFLVLTLTNVFNSTEAPFALTLTCYKVIINVAEM